MRIATYNVFNLNLGGCDAVATRKRAFQSLVWSINTLNADALVLQEVADDGVLERLNSALSSPYQYARVMQGNDVRGFHQAILARQACQSLSIENFSDQAADSATAPESMLSPITGYQRNLVMHQFNGRHDERHIELAVVSLHLKSGYVHPDRLLPDSGEIRLLEAHEVATWVNRWRQQGAGENAQTPLLIAGDLNESHDHLAVQTLCRELSLVDLIERDWVQRDRRPSYSWFTKNTKGRLDYLLADPNCLPLVVSDSPEIHVSAAMRKASDHYPLTINLNLELTIEK